MRNVLKEKNLKTFKERHPTALGSKEREEKGEEKGGKKRYREVEERKTTT